MCGLFGIASPGGQELYLPLAQNVLATLAVMNTTRGRDATGLGFVSKDTGTSVYKRAVAADNLIYKREDEWYLEVLTRLAAFCRTDEPWAIVGHTRAATVGCPKKDRNAHPFVVEGNGPTVLGAHNGCVSRWKEAQEKLGVEDMEVDSEVIFHGLHKYNEHNILRRLSPMASMALTYFRWDEMDDLMNMRFFRTVGADLYIRPMPEVGLLAWSSTSSSLTSATLGMTQESVVTPKGDHLWTVNLDNRDLLWDFKPTRKKKLSPKDKDPFVPNPAYTVQAGHHAAWDNYLEESDTRFEREMARKRGRIIDRSMMSAKERRTEVADICKFYWAERTWERLMNPLNCATKDQGDPRSIWSGGNRYLVGKYLVRTDREGIIFRTYKTFHSITFGGPTFPTIGDCEEYQKALLARDMNTEELEKIHLAFKAYTKEKVKTKSPQYWDATIPVVEPSNNNGLPGETYRAPYEMKECSLCPATAREWEMIWYYDYPHCKSCYDDITGGQYRSIGLVYDSRECANNNDAELTGEETSDEAAIATMELDWDGDGKCDCGCMDVPWREKCKYDGDA